MHDALTTPNGTGHDAGDLASDLVDRAEAFVDVTTAAARLGISEDGVRRRIQRGRLPAIKGTDGQWSIPAAALTEPNTTRQDRIERPAEQDTTHDTTPHDTPSAPAPDRAATQLLITALQDEVGYLRRQIEARDAELQRERAAREEERRRLDEALAEERRLLAGLIQRVPQLMGPQDSTTDTTELSPEQDTTVPPTAVEASVPATNEPTPTMRTLPAAEMTSPQQPQRPWWAFWRS